MDIFKIKQLLEQHYKQERRKGTIVISNSEESNPVKTLEYHFKDEDGYTYKFSANIHTDSDNGLYVNSPECISDPGHEESDHIYWANRFFKRDLQNIVKQGRLEAFQKAWDREKQELEARKKAKKKS